MKAKKNIFMSIMLAFVFMICGSVLTACGPKVTDIEIINGLPTVIQNDEPDWSSISAKVTFDDNTEKLVEAEDLIFDDVNTTELGNKEVSFKYKGSDVKFTITIPVVSASGINATITEYTGTYDGQNHNAIAVTGTVTGDVVKYSTDNTTWTTIVPEYKNAGTYTVYVKITRAFYPEQTVTKTVTINKKQLTVTADDKIVVFGNAAPTFTFVYDGFVNNENKSVITTEPTATSTYTTTTSVTTTPAITLAGGVDDNYSFNYVAGELTIQKATYDMTNVNWSYTSPYTYDGNAKTVALNGLPDGVTATYTNNSKTDAGTYTATAELHYDEVNYNQPSAIGNLTWKINKASISSINVTGYEGTYDAAAHGVTVSGTLTGDVVKYSTDNKTSWTTTAPTLTNAGSVTVYVKVERANYEDFISESKTITINEINDMGVTINGYTGEFDGNAHGITLNGTLAGDTIQYSIDNTTWTTTAPTLTNAGSQIVYVKISRENYEDANLSATIAIGKKAIAKPTADTTTYTYTGLAQTYSPVGYDADKMEIANNVQTNVNNGYEVTVTPKSNYKWNQEDDVKFTFVIERATLTVTADNKTVVYGDAAPTFTVSYTGFVNNETKAVLTTEAVATSTYTTTTPVGTVDITITTDAVAANYNFTKVKGTLTVTAKPLTKPTANTTTFTYNGTEQTYIPVGYDSNKMQITNNTKTDANENTVTVSAQSNYKWADGVNPTFTFVINKLTANLSWSATSLVFNGEAQAPTATVTNLINGTTCSVTVTGQNTNVGTDYQATASQLGNANYKLPTNNKCTYAITKATNAWTAEPGFNGTNGCYGAAKFGTITFTYKNITDNDNQYTPTAPTTPGKYMLKAVVLGNDNYTGLTTTKTFDISNVEKIYGFESTLLANYAANGGTQTNKQEEFVDANKTMNAGADNAFDLQVYGLDSDTDVVSNVKTTITFQKKNISGTFENVENDTYAVIDNYNNKIKFLPTAIGNTFKITVTPAAESIEEGYSLSPYVYEVNVVDGYNVYNAKDLSVIANGDRNGWTEWKQANGYADINTKSVIFQKDILVKDEDIPSYFFYDETEASAIPRGKVKVTDADGNVKQDNEVIVGTMKDGQGNGTQGNGMAIYHRDLAENDSFAIYGNYFQIDYSALTRAVVQSDGNKADGHYVTINDKDISKEEAITAHVSFLKFDGRGNTTSVDIKNASFKGNGQRSARSAYSGGLLLTKLNGLNSNVENCIYTDCFIGFMFDGGFDESDLCEYVFTNSKGYNCYNTLMYVYGIRNLIIEGGEFKGAGGPVMIVDHVDNDKQTGNGGHPSYVKVIDCEMESLVTGNEPWFVTYGATALVAQLTAPNACYTPFGTTYLIENNGITNLMNLKAVYKSSEAEAITGSKVRGGVYFYDTRAEYKAAENAATESGRNVGNQFDLSKSQLGSNVFENSFTGTTFIPLNETNNTYGAKNPDNSKTTNLNVYIANGMGIVLELYAITQD